MRSRRELGTFIKLPWRLYRNEPNWVAPLLSDLREQLDQQRNPFFEHAQAQYFLAWRDGRAVGRVSAHIDRNCRSSRTTTGGCGASSSARTTRGSARAAVRGRVVAARAWRRHDDRPDELHDQRRGRSDGRGLRESAADPQPVAPPLLPGAAGGRGGPGEGDGPLHVEPTVTGRDKVHPAIWEVAAKVESEHGIVCRNFRKRDLEVEVGRFLEVYNAAWERNWGFVPLTEREVRHYAKKLKPILDENWAMVAEKRDTGEVVGAALTLPDYNQVLAKLRPRGRLLPFGWLTALRERSKIDAVYVFALGVKPAYQHTGVAARFYQMHFDAAERTPQKGGEMGWILEVNKPMNRAMEGMGGEIKRATACTSGRCRREAPPLAAAVESLGGRSPMRVLHVSVARRHAGRHGRGRGAGRAPGTGGRDRLGASNGSGRRCPISVDPRARCFRRCRPPRWLREVSSRGPRSWGWCIVASSDPRRLAKAAARACGQEVAPCGRDRLSPRRREGGRAGADRGQPLAARGRAPAGWLRRPLRRRRSRRRRRTPSSCASRSRRGALSGCRAGLEETACCAAAGACWNGCCTTASSRWSCGSREPASRPGAVRRTRALAGGCRVRHPPDAFRARRGRRPAGVLARVRARPADRGARCDGARGCACCAGPSRSRRSRGRSASS